MLQESKESVFREQYNSRLRIDGTSMSNQLHQAHRKAPVSWDKVLGKNKYHITHDSKFQIPNMAEDKVSPTLPYPSSLDID